MSLNKRIRELLPEDAIVFYNHSYDNSIIGITTDDRVVYSFDKMVYEYMQDEECSMQDAIDWIEYNTIRALPYMGDNSPIIIYEYNTIQTMKGCG